METKAFLFLGWSGILLLLLVACGPSSQRNQSVLPEQQWVRLGPGGGGSTFVPTFSYASPDHFLIRCDMTGSYLTKDGGASYSQVNFANGASAFAYDPKDPNIVYVGSAFLNRSSDGGATWERLFPLEKDVIKERFFSDHASYSIETTDTALSAGERTVGSIRVDASRPGWIYFSMGPTFFYSEDNGKSWRRQKLDQEIHHLYTNNSSAKDEVYIFTAESIYVFNKSSNTYSRKDLPKNMSPAFSFTAGTLSGSDDMVFYALHHDAGQPIRGEFGYSEVWISTDKGGSWTRSSDPMVTNEQGGKNPSYSMISCAEADAGQAYIVTNRYEEKKADSGFLYWYGALKTGDAGKSWNWVWKGGGGSGRYGVKDGADAANLKDAWTQKAFGGEYIRLLDVGVSPADGNIAVVTDWYRVMKTTDGGRTWNQIYSIEQPDGTFSSNGMDVTTAYGVHTDPFDSAHIAISYTDIGYHHSYNGGKSWTRSVTGVPTEWVNTCYWMVFDPAVKGKLWSVWSGLHDFPRGKMTRNPRWKENAKGGICISSDGGKTWEPVLEGMGLNNPATSIVLDPRSAPNARTLYATAYNKGVFKSTDDGKTWTLKNRGIEDNTCAFEITLAENGVLYLTVSAAPMHKDGKRGTEYYSGAVYKSTDGAESWTKLRVYEGPIFPNSIEIDPENPNRIYLACWANISLSDLVGGDVTRAAGGNKTIDMKGGIFLSEDGGNTWKSIFDEDQYVYDVTADPRHKGRLYCNTFNKAAYRSDDHGATWKKIKGYDFHWGQRINIDQHDPEKIYITTFGSSVWHGLPAVE
ncbi:MAG: hypothetical protein JNL51_07850 [Chitinophagaceae bacterium]|nr:hypothetical protein [Chitinophagaceae bacterium]